MCSYVLFGITDRFISSAPFSGSNAGALLLRLWKVFTLETSDKTWPQLYLPLVSKIVTILLLIDE